MTKDVFMLYSHNYTRDIFIYSGAETRYQNRGPKFRKKEKEKVNPKCKMQPLKVSQLLQLGLLRLGGQVGEEDVAEFRGSLVQEVAHAVGAEALADDVEVQASGRRVSMPKLKL